jgi:flagellar biosynthetic protein FliR
VSTPTGFLLLLFRCAALVAALPSTGAPAIPMRIKLQLSVVLAIAVFFGAGMPAPTFSSSATLFVAIAQEILLGLVPGLAARFTLDATVGAGSAAGLSVGLGFGSTVDPTSGDHTNPLADLFRVVALSSVIVLGLHTEAVLWLARSARAVAPGADVDTAELIATVVWSATQSVALATRIAFPLLAAAMMGHLAMAALGRSAPQLNLGNLGFSVVLLAVVWATERTLPYIGDMAARATLEALRATS